MKLFIYDHFNPETLSINPGFDQLDAMYWGDSVIPSYSQCTDIKVINDFIGSAPDYKCGRDYIKELVLAGYPDEEAAFSDLSSDNKMIAAIHKLGTESQRNAVLGANGNYQAMQMYRIKTTQSRQLRGLRADVLLQNELPSDKMAVMSVATSPLNMYLQYGVEGIESGDAISGIRDYVNATNDYLLTGLKVQLYTPLTMTLNDLCDRLTGILIFGKN